MSFTLCNSFTVDLNIKNLFKNKKNNLTLEVCNDLIDLINDEHVDNNYIDRHILNKIIQITNSEYGFIGKVIGDKLHTKAITNIAWDEASYKFYMKNREHNMVFDTDKTIFGCSVKEKKPKIFNKYDNNRKVLPKGHPRIKRFMGVPLINKGNVIYFVGVCNKLTNYNKTDVKNIQKILDVVRLVLN